MKKPVKTQPAIFYDVDGTHKADTCEPLKAAKERNELQLEGYSHGCYPGHNIPPKMMPELCVACVWDAKKDQTWGLPSHRNEGIELGYLTRGSLDFTVEDSVHPLKGGPMTITRPWQPHQVGAPLVTASRMHWLIIDVGVRRPNDEWKWPEWINFAEYDLQRLTKLLSQNEQVVWQGNKQIEKCFEKIAEYVQSNDPKTVQTRLQLYINELFIEVYELFQKTDIKLNPKLISTRRSVDMFLQGLTDHTDYQWTLEEMAKHCNLGRSSFANYCKKITNMTPTQYLLNCRVKNAQKMLTDQPEKNITDIAFDCGFETSQYFATVFKKQTGKSPSEFRN